MTPRKKYKYDAEIIAKYESSPFRLSIREIARNNNWAEVGTHLWLERNYEKVITYVPKKKKDGSEKVS